MLSNGIPVLIRQAAVRRALSVRTGDRVRHFRRLFFALTPSSGCVGCAVRGTVCLISRAKLTRCGALGRGNFCSGVVNADTMFSVFYSDVGFGRRGVRFACCNHRHVRQHADVLAHRLIATNRLGQIPHASGGPRKLLVIG